MKVIKSSRHDGGVGKVVEQFDIIEAIRLGHVSGFRDSISDTFFF